MNNYNLLLSIQYLYMSARSKSITLYYSRTLLLPYNEWRAEGGTDGATAPGIGIQPEMGHPTTQLKNKGK